MRQLFSLALVLVIALVSVFGTTATTLAQSEQSDGASIYVFGRDDCGYCKKLFAWLDAEGIPYVYENVVTDDNASAQFNAIAEKHDVSKVTPITIIGPTIIVGFDSGATTGERIKSAVLEAEESDIRTPEEHIARAPSQDVVANSACTEFECASPAASAFTFDLPFFGVVDLRTFSLATLSIVLGTIDGFNPCAMWVLITFLVLLSQAGSRRKMIFLAGLFIFAEAVMYNLILNVWYKTWDFVALDQIVTPLVGLIAVGGGAFFLYRWYKNRDVALVCDISSIDQQNRTIDRFKRVINAPLTITSVVAIVAIAFSVNVIEFACSIGIPQAFTKILELNALTFLERQFYILIYTFGYMLDDLIVFGLAIWGYSKLEAHGQKFSQLSLLLGGLLMLILGAILVLNPQLLVLM